MIGPLRVALVAAAGAASLAWIAYRRLAPPRITRELDLASLDRHVAYWLPKLPYVPYIRLGIPGLDWLEMRGDGGEVRIIMLPGPGSQTAEHSHLFRETCADLGLSQAPDVHPSHPACAVSTESAAVTGALDALLRRVFGLGDGARLVATIPGGA